MRIILLSDDCHIQLLPKTHRHDIYIQSSVEGPHCGLIPIGMPSGSTSTTGLQWDLGKLLVILLPHNGALCILTSSNYDSSVYWLPLHEIPYVPACIYLNEMGGSGMKVLSDYPFCSFLTWYSHNNPWPTNCRIMNSRAPGISFVVDCELVLILCWLPFVLLFRDSFYLNGVWLSFMWQKFGDGSTCSFLTSSDYFYHLPSAIGI